MAMPSWAGVAGDAMSDAAIGYLEAFNKIPDERIARRKHELELLKLEEDTNLAKAKTQWELKRGGRPQHIETPWALFEWDDTAGKYAPTHLKPNPAEKELEILRGNARRNMEQVIGRKRGVESVPMNEFTPEEMTDRSISRLMDIYRGRSDYLSSPQGWVHKDDPALQVPSSPPATKPQTDTTQTTTGGEPPAKVAPPAKTTPVNTGAVRLGKTTPEMDAAIEEAHQLYPQVRRELIRAVMARESSYNPYVTSHKGAAGLMGIMPDTGKEMGLKDPFDVKQNVLAGTRYLAQQLSTYGGSEAMALAAYNAGPGRFDKGGRKLENMPPETQAYVPWVLARAGAGKPGATSTAATSSPPTSPAATPTTPAKTESPAAGAATPPTKPPAPVTTGSPSPVLIQTEAQKEDAERKRASDRREELRVKLQQQGLDQQAQEARLRELDRQEDNRRSNRQLQLAEEKAARDIAELEKANQRKDEAAAARITQSVMRETREARGMIQGVDETVALIQEMRRYISPETVGVKGAVRATIQSLWGQLVDAKSNQQLTGKAAAVQRLAMEKAGAHQQEADKLGGTWQLEENERAKAEGRAPSKIYIPDYSKYGYDPSMRFIDFLKEVIAYSHARAMNGPGRLTDQDLNRAQKSLGIDGWINSAADMQTSIGYVEKQLLAKKARAQAYAKSVETELRKHRPGPEAGTSDVTPPAEE